MSNAVDLEILRASLAAAQPAELRAMDESIAKLRAERVTLAEQLRIEAKAANGGGGSERYAMLRDELEALDGEINAQRQTRDQRRLELMPEIDEIVRAHLRSIAPDVIDAARLLQGARGVLDVVDRFLTVNRPVHVGSNLVRSLPSLDGLLRLARQLDPDNEGAK